MTTKQELIILWTNIHKQISSIQSTINKSVVLIIEVLIKDVLWSLI